MIVNRRSKIGLFEKKTKGNENGLLIFDFNTNEKRYLENYLEWEDKAISPDGERIAITTISPNKKAYRTEFVVLEHKTEQVILNTSDYYVYDTAFNAKGNKILIVADKKKPFCYDLELQQVTAEMPKQIRVYKGDLDLANDIFMAPCEATKDTCYLFDFKTGKTTTIKPGTNALLNRLKYAPDFSCIYAITDSNILYCFDRNFKIKWSKDFNSLGKQAGRINPSDIFITEDGHLLAVYTTSSETNRWGAEYVIDSTTGDIVRQIENYQYRGRFATSFFGIKVLLHMLKTIDLNTGTVSENVII